VVAKRLRELGLGIAATTGTAEYLAKFGQPVDRVVGKLSEIEGTALENAVDLVAQNEITFVVNTPHGRGSREDGEAIRKAANIHRVPSVTTVEAALAAVNGLWEQHNSEIEVRSLQEYHGR
jgi:carbamoyl-phosphate synthase large subunit